MSVTPALSVVIPSRDGRHLLADCLPPLLDDLAGTPAEVIVVDDGSTDGSLGWLSERFSAVRTIVLARGSGFAAACNAGARAAHAPIVAFLNNDALVRPGWSAALRAPLATDADVVIAGSLSLMLESPGLVASAGVRIAATSAASDIGLGTPLAELQPCSGAVAAVSGVSLAVNADWFAASGGFDERLGMYFEDVELCLRAWLEGRRVWLAADSVVLHRGSASAGGRYLPLRSRLGSRNRLRVAASVLDGARLVLAVPALIGQDLASVLWLAAHGEPLGAAASARDRVRGTASALAALPGLRREYRARAAHRARRFADLRALGLIAPPAESLREFARLRRREIENGPL